MLVLQGSSFVPGATVSIGGALATEVSVWSGTRITARLPENPTAFGTVPVVVTNPDGQAATWNDRFLYHAGPPLLSNALFDEGSHEMVATGDLNRDGKLDLIVDATNSIDVLLNNGTGGFTISNFAVGTKPIFAAVAYFDDDQYPDIVVANNGSNDVSILLGTSSGSFRLGTTVAVGTAPASLVIDDFDGDTKMDIVVANSGSNSLSVLLGNGRGGTSPATTISVGTKPVSVAVGDWDGDQRLDLAVATFTSKTVSVGKGDGNGGFESWTDISVSGTPTSLVVSDFNGDKMPDLAVGNQTSLYMNVLLGNGKGFDTPRNIRFDYSGCCGYPSVKFLVAGDLNGDKHVDLALSCFSSQGSFVMLGDGAGGFSAAKRLPFFQGSRMLAMGDLTGDGQLDLASATAAGLIMLLGDGQGSFTDAQPVASGLSVSEDFNSDHILDSVFVAAPGPGSGAVSLYSSAAAGGVPVISGSSVNGDAPYSLAAADVTNDGNLDLVVVSTSHVNVLAGDGMGNLGPPFSLSTSGTGRQHQVVLGDFDGDTKSDIVVTELGTQLVEVFFGDSRGSFERGISFLVPDAPVLSMAAADFNGDRRIDLALGQPGAVAVVLGPGGRGAPQVQRWLVSGSGIGIAVGELNGDKKTDIAFVDPAGSTVGMLLGDGFGGFSQPALFPTGTAPSCVLIRDMNGDNKDDLIVTRQKKGILSVSLGNGQGGFAVPQLFGTINSLGCAVSGDWNGDRKMDLAVSGYSGSFLYLNQTP